MTDFLRARSGPQPGGCGLTPVCAATADLRPRTAKRGDVPPMPCQGLDAPGRGPQCRPGTDLPAEGTPMTGDQAASVSLAPCGPATSGCGVPGWAALPS